MGDGSSGARAFLAWATIGSLAASVAGLFAAHFAGPPVGRRQASQRRLELMSRRLANEFHGGQVSVEARKALEGYAATSRPLLLLLTGPHNRIILSVPSLAFLPGKEVNAERDSAGYGQVILEGGESEVEAPDRFYPRGYSVSRVEVRTDDGELAGCLWATRAPSRGFAPRLWPVVLGGIAYWLLLPWWVFVDARTRRARALPFAILTLVTNAAGWAAYMATRPEFPAKCGGCGRALAPAFRVCPSCGQPVSGRCPQCGAPVREDWLFCPYCEHGLAEPPEEQPASGPSD